MKTGQIAESRLHATGKGTQQKRRENQGKGRKKDFRYPPVKRDGISPGGEEKRGATFGAVPDHSKKETSQENSKRNGGDLTTRRRKRRRHASLKAGSQKKKRREKSD